MNEKLFNERVEAAQNALLENMKSAKVDDEDYAKKMTIANAMYKAINEDNKNNNEFAIEREKLESEKDKTKHEWIGTVLNGVLSVCTIASTIFGVVYTEKNMNRRFNTASKFEENDAYLTQTQKSTVSEGLKSKHTIKFL